MAGYMSFLEGPTVDYDEGVKKLREYLEDADAVIVGAGFGLSVAAGLHDSGERFERLFGDFEEDYGIHSMYAGACYRFDSEEEWWAYYTRWAWNNRYEPLPKDTYEKLKRLLEGKDYFILTTNIDHAFQRSGFPKERLHYTQGDLGLLQCATPCHAKTYDNKEILMKIRENGISTKVPKELIPRCPVCGGNMDFNLYWDDRFVRDSGWYKAHQRWNEYLNSHKKGKILFLELGVGFNSPGVIKIPFWQEVKANPQARFVTIDYSNPVTLNEIEDRSMGIRADIDQVFADLLAD